MEKNINLRVMTFNLRFENDRDGDNAWQCRKDIVVRLIEKYRPDILGTQEGKWDQLHYLIENLNGYSAHMPGRVEDKHAQCPTLFVRTDRFVICQGGDFWLSKTPDVYMSKDWDSAFPRMMSHAELKSVKNENIKLFAAVTHLDHMGKSARVHQAEIIAGWAGKTDGPKLVMGDFNEEPGADVYQLLADKTTGLCDTWKAAGGTCGPESFTHHGFTGVPKASRIDWILASDCFSVKDAKIIRYQEDGFYPSDHFPYMVDLSLDDTM
jgi:endonuclease/exonuclease/phosphatase family metal-dependent hydrolase